MFPLEQVFDSVIDSYVEEKMGVTPDFISKELAAQLRSNLLSLFSENQMQSACIGADVLKHQNNTIRTDKIYWLDRSHGNEVENAFLDRMDEFVSYLNRTCYTGINEYEFHYAMYEPGSFYKRHLDQFKNNDSRQFSVIIYLNEGWMPGDGGELCVYHGGTEPMLVQPVEGNMVFFKSGELEHEVLTTTKPRLSVTGWLKK